MDEINLVFVGFEESTGACEFYLSIDKRLFMRLLKKLTIQQLTKKVMRLGRDVVEVAARNGAGHIAPSLSSVDILTALYYSVTNLSDDPSMGRTGSPRILHCQRVPWRVFHSCRYWLLNRRDWDNFYSDSFLMGCIERSAEHGIEASCGSLGHGLPIAVGIAFGAKLREKIQSILYCR